MTVCSYHVTYAIQSETTLYSCLNVKELLARSRPEINGCKKEVIKKRLKHRLKVELKSTNRQSYNTSHKF